MRLQTECKKVDQKCEIGSRNGRTGFHFQNIYHLFVVNNFSILEINMQFNRNREMIQNAASLCYFFSNNLFANAFYNQTIYSSIKANLKKNPVFTDLL